MNVLKLRWAIGVSCGLVCLPALAVLGGAPSVKAGGASAASDAPAISVRSAGAGMSAYQVLQSVDANGQQLREYVDAKGTVFCVAWTGALMPDLKALFGEYYERYAAYLKERREQGIRGPVAMQDDALVVESGGHMRRFAGRAYVPSLLPANVDLESLK